MRSKGMSLPELLVAMGLFLLLMAMASKCFFQCVKAYRQNQEKAPLFRHVAIGAALIARELRMCEEIYFPENEEDLKAPFYPKKDETPPFIFLMGQGEKKELIAYTLEQRTKTIQRAIYEIAPAPTADPQENSRIVIYPEDPPTFLSRLKLKKPFCPIGHDTALMGIRFLRRDTDEFLEMRAYPAVGDELPLETKVRIKRGFSE
ncbi:MAG: prepilin-type N-terminal cleavage/methylation domain-containing protein [bacterium]